MHLNVPVGKTQTLQSCDWRGPKWFQIWLNIKFLIVLAKGLLRSRRILGCIQNKKTKQNKKCCTWREQVTGHTSVESSSWSSFRLPFSWVCLNWTKTYKRGTKYKTKFDDCQEEKVPKYNVDLSFTRLTNGYFLLSIQEHYKAGMWWEFRISSSLLLRSRHFGKNEEQLPKDIVCRLLAEWWRLVARSTVILTDARQLAVRPVKLDDCRESVEDLSASCIFKISHISASIFV